MGAVGNYEVVKTTLSTSSTTPVEEVVSAPAGKVILGVQVWATNNDAETPTWIFNSDGTITVTIAVINPTNTGTWDVYTTCAEMGN